MHAVAVTCEGSFRLEGYERAASVWLTGDFVAWAGTPEDGAVALALGEALGSLVRRHLPDAALPREELGLELFLHLPLMSLGGGVNHAPFIGE